MRDNYTDFLEQTLKEQINITLSVIEQLHGVNEELSRRTVERDYWKEKADDYRKKSEEC